MAETRTGVFGETSFNNKPAGFWGFGVTNFSIFALTDRAWLTIFALFTTHATKISGATRASNTGDAIAEATASIAKVAAKTTSIRTAYPPAPHQPPRRSFWMQILMKFRMTGSYNGACASVKHFFEFFYSFQIVER
nr:hypothetical protein [Ferrovum sp.]